MKIIIEEGLRKLIPENDENQILNIVENIISKSVYIAKGINDNNINSFFKEITKEEKQINNNENIS